MSSPLSSLATKIWTTYYNEHDHIVEQTEHTVLSRLLLRAKWHTEPMFRYKHVLENLLFVNIKQDPIFQILRKLDQYIDAVEPGSESRLDAQALEHVISRAFDRVDILYRNPQTGGGRLFREYAELEHGALQTHLNSLSLITALNNSIWNKYMKDQEHDRHLDILISFRDFESFDFDTVKNKRKLEQEEHTARINVDLCIREVATHRKKMEDAFHNTLLPMLQQLDDVVPVAAAPQRHQHILDMLQMVDTTRQQLVDEPWTEEDVYEWKTRAVNKQHTIVTHIVSILAATNLKHWNKGVFWDNIEPDLNVKPIEDEKNETDLSYLSQFTFQSVLMCKIDWYTNILSKMCNSFVDQLTKSPSGDDFKKAIDRISGLSDSFTVQARQLTEQLDSDTLNSLRANAYEHEMTKDMLRFQQQCVAIAVAQGKDKTTHPDPSKRLSVIKSMLTKLSKSSTGCDHIHGLEEKEADAMTTYVAVNGGVVCVPIFDGYLATLREVVENDALKVARDKSNDKDQKNDLLRDECHDILDRVVFGPQVVSRVASLGAMGQFRLQDTTAWGSKLLEIVRDVLSNRGHARTTASQRAWLSTINKFASNGNDSIQIQEGINATKAAIHIVIESNRE